tara:strand:- start:2570 stop:2788 length:219 start_codon:yes stop_codon:yes gene_type:complete
MTAGGEGLASTNKSALGSLANEEILNLVDRHIPLEIRLDYLRFKNGLKLPKPRRDAVKKAIYNIIKEHGLDG